MSKSKHLSRAMPKRHFLPLLQGDPSPLPALPRPNPEPFTPIPDATLDSLSTRELIQLALSLNIDPKLVLGVPHCNDHGGHTATLTSRTLWVAFNPAFTNAQSYHNYTHGIDIVWCRSCFSWWRMTSPVPANIDTPPPIPKPSQVIATASPASTTPVQENAL